MVLTIFGLIGIGFFDALDPLPFVVITNILTKRDSIKNLSYFLVPYWLFYFLFGAMGVFLFERIEDTLFSLPFDPNYIAKAIALLLLLLGAYVLFIAPDKSKESEPELEHVSGLKYAVLAVILLVTNLPFSYPYFGVISELAVQDIAFKKALGLVLVYTLAFITPYIAFAIAYKLFDHQAKAIVDKAVAFISHRYVVGGLLIAVGAYMVIFYRLG